MNIDEQLNQLSQQTCPWQVDVEDRVMEQVRQHPYLITQSPGQSATQTSSVRKYRWVPWAALTAAAAAVGLVLVNTNQAAATPTYNVEQISDMMALVADSDNYYTSDEADDENLIEYLYDDYDSEYEFE